MNVGIRELRDGLSRYVAEVQEGQTIVVTDHGRPVARLVAYDGPSGLEALIASGLVTPALKPKVTLPQPVGGSGTVSDLVREQRR